MYRFIIVSAFILVAACNFWGSSYTITHAEMQNSATLRWEQDSTVLVMAGNASLPTASLRLKKGKYSIRFQADGTFSSGMAPHLVVGLGDYTIKNMFISAGLNNYQFNFELPQSIEAPLYFVFDNDHRDSTGDRNIFLHYPITIKPY
jgi:hypothetical protein